jgi:hydroxyethylthiazole kinase-like uncharacterized protein yjeF
MQKIFDSTRVLDKSAIEKYGLSEDVLMENAATELCNNVYLQLHLKSIKQNNKTDNTLILIVCGSGDNGGDGYAVARRFFKDETIVLYSILEPKSKMCKIQKDRAQKAGVKFISSNEFTKYTKKADVIIDCIFGSGFHGVIPEEIKKVLDIMNKSKAIKVACDIPSGMYFNADVTVTMGALKTVLFSDEAKDHTGLIVTGNLGVSRKLFENNAEPAAFLLEKTDMHLPHRKKQNTNKGTYGHTVIVCGEKPGAGMIAGVAALSFGSGLVTAIDAADNLPGRNTYRRCNTDEAYLDAKTDDLFKGEAYDKNLKLADVEIMHSIDFPENTTAVALGMGFGRKKDVRKFTDYLKKNKNIAACIDADMFYKTELLELLQKKRNIVLTPHPKEFSSLLKICGIKNKDGKDYSVKEILENRKALVEEFCRKFPGVVLLLKGANVLIGRWTEKKGLELFVNNYGKPCLSKAGSGDVLSGMIASLLSQKYDVLQAAISGSLAHALASRLVSSDFGMTPFDLINCVKSL